MAEDWAADVKKFVPDADGTVIAAIVRYCGIALQNRDSSLVSFTDPVETGRVRDNFLKKKLGLTQPDEELDQGIAAVGERMKGVNFKNRVTAYYLLLEHFGMLHLFGNTPAAGGDLAAGAAAAGVGAAALGVAGLGAADEVKAATAAPPPAPDFVSAGTAEGVAYGALDEGDAKGGFGWWPWLILALLALALLWWLFFRTPGTPTSTDIGATSAGGEATSITENASTAAGAAGNGAGVAAGAVDIAAAPPEGSVTIPTGAGVTAETRDGKPVVKVYFDTGKTDVAPAFVDTAGALKTYLGAHSGSSLAVSGYNDKTGNAAANAELSKNRAQAVKAALVSAGIADTSVALVKPEETTDASTSNEAARRVEVVVK